MPGRLLAVHPHPDDEAIACGGVIAGAMAAGHDVHVVTCTGGEEGENQSGIDLGGVPMEVVRRREMADAITELGGPTHHWLGYRDSGMAGEAANDHPAAFHAADLYDASARLARLVRRVRPHVVVSDDETGTYGHPDHIRAHRVTERAIVLAADPWWTTPEDGEPWATPKRYVTVVNRDRAWELQQALAAAGLASAFGDQEFDGPEDLPYGQPRSAVTTSIDVRDQLAAKRAAMTAHASQIGPDSFFLNLPEEIGGGFFGVEEFQLLHGEASPDDDGLEHDLFAGIVG